MRALHLAQLIYKAVLERLERVDFFTGITNLLKVCIGDGRRFDADFLKIMLLSQFSDSRSIFSPFNDDHLPAGSLVLCCLFIQWIGQQ